MPIQYKIVAIHSDEPPIEDPPEEWVQDGVNYPQGEPPPGVQSPTEAIPEFRAPNFVAPTPLPAPHVEGDVPEHPDEPPAEHQEMPPYEEPAR